MMKILLSAFSCIPDRGSEPGIGWGVFQQVAAHHDTWVLTAPDARPLIEQALGELPLPNARFIYVNLPRWVPDASSTLLYNAFCYFPWQIRAFWVARRLHKEINFDLVHHVTFGNAWQPTWMGWLGIPFVWSAGGRDKMPISFFPDMSWRGRIYEWMRDLAINLLGVITYWATARRARIILSASDPSLWNKKLPVKRFPIGGLSAEELARLNAIPQRRGTSFRVLSIGRLLGWKGIALGIKAFARLHRDIPESEYWIIGDGFERKKLERLAHQLRIDHAIRFWGFLPRDEVLECLNDIDVLLHPSFHEQFGYVILEAMAAARPVICLDVGGPPILVDSTGGMTVAVTSPSEVIDGLHRALYELASDPEKRLELGNAARKRVNRRWGWDSTGNSLMEIYGQACD